jgi:hypothetical protein
MGLGGAETGRTIPAGGIPDRLVRPRRVAGDLGVFERESRLEAAGGEPLVKPSLFGNRQMTGTC